MGIRVASLILLLGLSLNGQSVAEAPPDPLAALGLHVTDGAAAGYVDDRLCARCHIDVAKTYAGMGMARSFYRPRPETAIEDFSTEFYHSSSQRYYSMELRDGRYVFQRYQRDPRGQKIHEVEQSVDWVLGSGNHVRTYLHRNPIGELYQLPLAWYTQDLEGNPIPGRWGMPPGYDNAFHLGIGRRVQRECMFCHNGYPDVPAGSDLGSIHTFPEELPEGTGCQRCHGPGAEHSRLAFGGTLDEEPLRSSIVNPALLPPRERDDVCYSCHMQPSVAIFGLRHLGRSTYSFRPGEKLSDYLVQVDVEEDGRPKAERFEINHHPYRMEQSACFIESGGALNCLTCHDPHRKILPAERADHYRPVCLSCHALEACGREHMAGQDPATVDCTSCHMPKRRPQDVIQVVMTDHKIQRTADPAYLEPREEFHPDIVDIELLDPEAVPPGALREVYRAMAVLMAGGTPDARQWLEQHLPQAKVEVLDPWFELAQAQLREGRYGAVRDSMLAFAEKHPENAKVFRVLGIAEAGLGNHDKALESLFRSIELAPGVPESYFNVGHTALADDQVAAALINLERAVDMRPNLAVAWYYLGQTYRMVQRDVDAHRAFERSMAIDPTDARPYLAAGRLLRETRRAGEAKNLWQHGVGVVRDPKALEAALAELRGESGGQGAQ